MSFAVLLLAENILAIDGSFLFAFISILLLIFILNAIDSNLYNAMQCTDVGNLFDTDAR